MGVYDINYVDHWQRRHGVSLAEAIAAKAIAATPPTTAATPSTTPPPAISAGTAGSASVPNLHAPGAAAAAAAAGAAAAAAADSGGGLGLQHGATTTSSSSGISGIIGAMTGLGFSSTKKGGTGGAMGGGVDDVTDYVPYGEQGASGSGSGEGVAGTTPFMPNSVGVGLALGGEQAPRSIHGYAGGVWPVLKVIESMVQSRLL